MLKLHHALPHNDVHKQPKATYFNKCVLDFITRAKKM